jgi:histidinol-phosphate/aromatic aminotransferase/cobyric acid decarboxylase-like protein
MEKSFHAGEFFHAIGNDFSTLERSAEIINADVLDAWFDPSPKVIKKIQHYLPFILRTSPPNYSEGLIRTISDVRGIPEDHLISAEGSSELIFTFFQNMVSKKEKVLILDPMYGEYAHVLHHLCDAEVVLHMLKKENEFQIEPDLLLEDIRTFKPGVVVLVNPNSPTGKYLPKDQMLSLVKSISQDTTVIIDETYIEYAGSEHSLEKYIAEFENMVIIKSMSKVYALSGARVGYLAARKDIINRLSVFIPPWAVSLFGQIAGVEALKDQQYYDEKYTLTHLLRQEVYRELSQRRNLRVNDSIANFYLLELLDPTINAEMVRAALQKDSIYIRNPDSMSTQFGGRFLRIAIKNKDSNEKIIAALKKIVGGNEGQ